MNHLVPEQMFSTEANKAQGISAVKALAIASQEGQKIWTIDKTNLDLALSKITLDIDAEQDIRNAVNAGKVVTAHEAQINFNGRIGEGYVVLDKETGAGAYIIAGGGNGAFLKVLDVLGWISFAIGTNQAIKTVAYAALKIEGVLPVIGVVANILNLATTVLSFAAQCKDPVISAAFAFLFGVLTVLGTIFAIGTFGVGGAILSLILGVVGQFLSMNVAKIAEHC